MPDEDEADDEAVAGAAETVTVVPTVKTAAITNERAFVANLLLIFYNSLSFLSLFLF